KRSVESGFWNAKVTNSSPSQSFSSPTPNSILQALVLFQILKKTPLFPLNYCLADPSSSSSYLFPKMMLRIRSRDGLERVSVDNPSTTIAQLKTLIQSQLQIPIHNQTLSTNQNLLLAKSPSDLLNFADMADPSTTLSSLKLGHGSIVFLSYEGERNIAGPTVFPSGSFGRKMTMDDLIAKQMKVTRQENPHCDSVSFDRDCANAFQHYVNETLAFAIKRGGFMYGTVSEEGKVQVDFIYEPPQQGTEEVLLLLRDSHEEKSVEAIAAGLGMRKVGFIFTQTISQDKKDYTLSNREVLQAAELHAESQLKEWVTAVVKLEVSEDGAADVHFEAFQLSDMCVRLFKEGWFETEIRQGVDPKLSIMKKDVVLGVKDVKEVDNDFFLVVVKILDHMVGPLSSTFPIENRVVQVTMKALKNHLERARSLPFVKRISDFHLLLFLSRFLDNGSDVPALAECVVTQTTVAEGYQILIESMASTG
ncbi:NPL4-like protein 1, partial [Linum perenne]